MSHSQLPMWASDCASRSRAAVSASSAVAAWRSARVAPSTSRLTTTTANPAWASWTCWVAVSPPSGTCPATAPHVPMAPTMKADAAAPSCLKRRAAQRTNGKMRYGYRQAPARNTSALTLTSAENSTAASKTCGRGGRKLREAS